MSTVAALYVDPRGIYAGRPDVDVWDVARDARLYERAGVQVSRIAATTTKDPA